MPPRLDPVRREIAVGARRLPFRLDLRNDRVSVMLGGTEVAVRPLQWREKLTLARFAHLGPEFLREELVRLCTVSELPSPLAADDVEVLWELAAWMSEPPASIPVPLDSRSLASVTLRLCRSMGLKPADFDGRSAPEVEAMWEALGTAPEESEEAADDSSSSFFSSSSGSATTRIVIVPDDDASERSEAHAPAIPPAAMQDHSPASGPARQASPDGRPQTTVRAVPAANATTIDQATTLDAVLPSVSRGIWTTAAVRGATMVPPVLPGPSTHTRDDSMFARSSVAEIDHMIDGHASPGSTAATVEPTSLQETPPVGDAIPRPSVGTMAMTSAAGASASAGRGRDAHRRVAVASARETPIVVHAPHGRTMAMTASLPSEEDDAMQAPMATAIDTVRAIDAPAPAFAATSAPTSALMRSSRDAHRHLALASPSASVAMERQSPPAAASASSFTSSVPVQIENAAVAAMTSAELSLSLVKPDQTGFDSVLVAPHDLFEELADRLEQAAAEMGIGEG